MALDWLMDGVKATKNYFSKKDDEIIGYSTEYGEVQSTGLSAEELAKDVVPKIPSVEELAPNVSKIIPKVPELPTSTTFNPAMPKDISSSPVKPVTPVSATPKAVDYNQNKSLPIPNPLDIFASFNYIITLAVLTTDEVNDPSGTYRKIVPENIILRSGGGIENTPGIVGSNAWDGKIEYFIDNLSVESIISATEATRHTNATNIEFDVVEPYGLGTFIQSIMKASKNAGHQNHLTAPFLLMVDFVGWDDDGKSPMDAATKKSLRRTIPIKLSNVTFTVDESGSKYKVSAYPWNEQATLNSVESLPTNAKISGRTVKECCQSGLYSIANAFNGVEQGKRKVNPEYVADEYIIVFPKSHEEDVVSQIKSSAGATQSAATTNYFQQSSAGGVATVDTRSPSGEEEDRLWASFQDTNIKEKTFKDMLKKDVAISIKRSNDGEAARKYADSKVNTNKIGEAKIVENPQDQVKHPFMAPILAELNLNRDGIFDRKYIKIQDNVGEFTFKSGTTIEDMIEELIIMSDYGRMLMEQTPDSNGMIDWFRIETNLFAISGKGKEESEGRSAYIYIYKVLPFKTHSSRFTPVSNIVDLTTLKNQCVKEYNYMYTGKNDSIRNFSINIDSAFYVALNNTHLGKHGTRTKMSDSRGKQSKPTNIVQTKGKGVTSNIGQRSTQTIHKNTTGNQGGGHHENEKSVAARNMNDIFLSSATDLIMLEMEIQGDPYFLMDSGTGNYKSSPTEYINLSSDGTMYIHNGEVDVMVTFKSPIDYGYAGAGEGDKQGYMSFDNGYEVTAYSGVYHVTTVTNNFSNGEFTQTLQLVRRPMQAGIDNESAPPAPPEEKAIKTNGLQEIYYAEDYLGLY